ncbi:MAG: hypothetical protein HYW57_02325 [Ignavibacteriales bacterium]|nr:hypothetical protein [Ignavibacteriales bacterium]
MKKRICLLIVLLGVPVFSNAQIPRTLSYQAVLTDTLGNPRPDGQYSFTFRLYQSSSGGTAIYTEQKNLQLRRGLFYTVLGDQIVLPDTVRFDRAYWLSVQVATEPELSPRVPLTSVGYSIRAVRADTASHALSAPQQTFIDSARIAGTIPDNSVTTSKVADNAITSIKILDGAILTADLADNAVTSAKIVDGTIAAADIANGALTMPKINQSGATLGQVIKWTGTGWAPGSDTAGSFSLPFAGSASNTGGAVFGVTNTAATGTNYGIFGTSNSTSGRGLYGFASTTSGQNYGVWGASNSTAGFGVLGLVNATGGQNYGVYGASNSTLAGFGLYGTAPVYGAYGQATATSGLTYGVSGRSNSTAGRGVYGLAFASSGVNYGVFGQTNSPSGYAGYFQGNVQATGTIHSTAGGFRFPDGTVQTSALPSGVIVMWSGLLANIPSGWALCDGTNGTPDLRDRFIWGTSAGQNPGPTGGDTSHFHSVNPPTTQTTAPLEGSNVIFGSPISVSLAASDAHTHDVNILTFSSGTDVHLPPYFKLAFIMKL